MILPDVNVLVYAHRADAPNHAAYRRWLEDVINGDQAYGMADIVLSGFLRVVTHPRILTHPATWLRRLLSPLNFATSQIVYQSTQEGVIGLFSSVCAKRLGQKVIWSLMLIWLLWPLSQVVSGLRQIAILAAFLASIGVTHLNKARSIICPVNFAGPH
jgi:hypothetical protein